LLALPEQFRPGKKDFPEKKQYQKRDNPEPPTTQQHINGEPIDVKMIHHLIKDNVKIMPEQ
jgi:hypothetical protein